MSETAPVRNEDTIGRDRLAVATACLQGVIAGSPRNDMGGAIEGMPDIHMDVAAQWSIDFADALLAKLSAPRPDAEVNAEATVGDRIAAEFSCDKVYLEPHEQRRLAAMIDAAKPDAEVVQAMKRSVDFLDAIRTQLMGTAFFHPAELLRGELIAALARVPTT